MCNNHEIKGKCQSTFHGVFVDPSTYLHVLHFGHHWAFFKVSQKNTHPFVHAWIESNLIQAP
jgi:hypothetical protein